MCGFQALPVVTVTLSEREDQVDTTMANSVINTTVPDSFEESRPSTAINGSCITAEAVQTCGSGRFQTGFGCLRCRPACLQFLASARWFLLFMCLSTFFQSMVVNGLLGVTISTIERRFGLSSSQSAWIAVSYEIAGVPALLVVGYLGSTLRRPVWMGSGLIMLGIGFGVYSIPHFAAPPYRYMESGDSSNLCVETASNVSSNTSLPMNDRFGFEVFINTIVAQLSQRPRCKVGQFGPEVEDDILQTL